MFLLLRTNDAREPNSFKMTKRFVKRDGNAISIHCHLPVVVNIKNM